jgi:hypothetical protein
MLQRLYCNVFFLAAPSVDIGLADRVKNLESKLDEIPIKFMSRLETFFGNRAVPSK